MHVFECKGLSLPPPLFFHNQELFAKALYTIQWKNTGWRQIRDPDYYMPMAYLEPCPRAVV